MRAMEYEIRETAFNVDQRCGGKQPRGAAERLVSDACFLQPSIQASHRLWWYTRRQVQGPN